MLESIISEGKTTNEAIENGLKKLNVSRNEVEIKVLENVEKRSFFSILAPRVVKVELKLKERKNINNSKNIVSDIDARKEKIEKFLELFIEKLPSKDISYNLTISDNYIIIELLGEFSKKLIGYRGETLNSLQNILSSIGNKNYEDKVKVILDIQGYREKRKNTLEELALKVSKTVLKTGKSITLEPMTAYERKIIHSKLQEDYKINTYSIGEEPNRRVVITKK